MTSSYMLSRLKDRPAERKCLVCGHPYENVNWIKHPDAYLICYACVFLGKDKACRMKKESK